MKAFKQASILGAVKGGVRVGSKLNSLPAGTIRIDGEVWTQKNYNKSVTPMEFELAEKQTPDYVEQVSNWVNDDFASFANFGAEITQMVSSANGNNCFANVEIIAERWYRLRFLASQAISARFRIADNNSLLTNPVTVIAAVSGGLNQVYFKPVANKIKVGFQAFDAFTDTQISDFSLAEIGWSGFNDLYTGLISQGYIESDALKEVAVWCSHNNDPILETVYGKIYNSFGKTKLVEDIATKEDYGWHVATEAELTALALNGGYALKEAGTDHWLTDTGTNTTKFTALGGGTRSGFDGDFNTIKETTAFWCADSDKVLTLNHADNSAVISNVTKDFGAYIRLVSDSIFPIPLT